MPFVDEPVPHRMHAVQIDRFERAELPPPVEVPVPEPRPKDVLIRAHAASINPRDWMIRAGTYPFRAMLPSPPIILGSDVAGVVVATGARAGRFRVGDRVLAMQPSTDGFGAYAEYVTVRETAVAHLDPSVPFDQAAGIPLAGLTALQALRDEGRLRAGDDLVVVGAVGGVGHYAVQLAKILGARRIIGVCSAPNHELARELGCHETIDYRQENYADVVRDVDLVFDTLGRGSLGEAAPALVRRGTYVTTVPTAATLSSTLRSRILPIGRRCRIVLVRSNARDLELLAGWAAEGRLRTIVDRVEPLCRASLLHEHSRSFRTRGKNVLRLR